MKLPTISIITPTFNAALTVEKTLLSVIAQEYKQVEHLFIDGGSEDATIAIIRKYQQQYDHIRLISEKDKGLYDAINKGMVLSTGDWIYIMGADDVFYNKSVLSDLAAQGWFGKEQVVYGNVLISGDAPWAKANTIYDGPFDLEKLYRKNLCHQSIFYPRSVITRVGYYSVKYPVTADWDYNMHCFAKYKFAFTGMTMAIFNAGGTSSGEDNQSFFHDMPEKVIQYFQLNPRDKSHERPESPYYYPMSRYRENELLKGNKLLEQEILRLRDELSRQGAESETTITKLQQELEALRSTLETAIRASRDAIQQKETEYRKTLESGGKKIERLNQIIEEKEVHSALTIASARRNTENLRAELEEHKRVIDSMVNSYTWKTGRMILAPFRFLQRKK